MPAQSHETQHQDPGAASDAALAARAPFGIAELDARHRVVAANAALLALLGRGAADVVGRPLVDFVAAEHAERCRWPDAGGDADWDVGLVSPHGGTPQVRLHVRSLPHGDRTFVYVRDEAPVAPASWQEQGADERYAKLLHNIEDVITVCDAAGVVQKNLGHFDELLGWPSAHWEGRTVFEFAHPDEAEQARAEFRLLLEMPGVPVVRQFRTRHHDGRWAWLELTAINMLDDPSVRAVIIISRNVTARRRLEEQQRTQAELLELIACGARLDLVLARVTQMVENHLPDARVAVLVRENEELRVGAGPRLEPVITELIEGSSVTRWSGALRRTLLGGRIVSGDLLAAELDPTVSETFAQLGIHGFTAVPIVQEPDPDVVSGILLVLLERTEPLDADEERVATNAARLAAIAVQRHRVELRLSHLAHHDKLTGLPNRVLMQQHLDEGIRVARTHRSSIAVMFLDLDNFKIVNDSLGHAAGDHILIGFAERLGKLLRPGDIVGRFGGDEFVVLIENVSSAADAAPVAERLLEDLRHPFRIGDETVFLSVSVGIAVSHGGRDSSEALLHNADAAMYQAKAQGRSRIEIYDDHMPERAARRLQIEGDLHRALDAEQFVLHWQPKISLATGRIVSAEALLRWMHPERGLILPIEFVSITEELELIDRIGEWVLADAIRQRATWESEHGDEAPWSIAVNVSALQLSGPKAVDTVTRVLNKWDWAPERLVLELTETVLMDEVADAHTMLKRLKQLGCQIAIDDFGTGYSSLSYLHRFPVDQVKLDRAFVANIDADGEGSPIARAVINMAHALGITVTAEGVETEVQLHGLRRLGCDRAQGFHLARPMPADEFSALLRRKPRYDTGTAS